MNVIWKVQGDKTMVCLCFCHYKVWPHGISDTYSGENPTAYQSLFVLEHLEYLYQHPAYPHLRTKLLLRLNRHDIGKSTTKSRTNTLLLAIFKRGKKNVLPS